MCMIYASIRSQEFLIWGGSLCSVEVKTVEGVANAHGNSFETLCEVNQLPTIGMNSIMS